jgi:hypothetical protein
MRRFLRQSEIVLRKALAILNQVPYCLQVRVRLRIDYVDHARAAKSIQDFFHAFQLMRQPMSNAASDSLSQISPS